MPVSLRPLIRELGGARSAEYCSGARVYARGGLTSPPMEQVEQNAAFQYILSICRRLLKKLCGDLGMVVFTKT